MSLDRFTYQGAIRDFQQARFQAALRHVLARLTRTSDELLSYDQVAEQLRLSARSDRGVQAIPVAAIVGSVGRAADFTREFLPRRADDMQRWARVRNAYINPQGSGLPPIEVYQVGEVYFVLDGNHRVSVARREGATYIDAHVIEIQTSVPLTPDVTPDDLICKAELAEFLQDTGLDQARFGFDFQVNLCGQYPKLREQIAVHQILARRAAGRDVALREAAADWLAKDYAPFVRAMREQDLLRWFPDHTETDVYLWVTEHQHQLQEELGWSVRPDAALTDLAARSNLRARQSAPDAWREQRLTDRYLDHLFMDVLVPLNNAPETWTALEQAILLAQKENASLHGLHVVRAQGDKTSAAAQALAARFQERCARAQVACDVAIEAGNVTNKIRERTLLADLVVLNLAHPPGGGLTALTSRWRSLVQNAVRPILAVPHPSPMQRALLIFDASPKARQALFVAAYLGEMWKTALTVLTVENSSRHAAVLDEARAYLELHEVDADYIGAAASGEIFLETVGERGLDVLLIANDSASPWQQVRGSNVINFLLRQAPCPLLIC